ncbi:hypothetical protein L207DRAFT_162322 [Hyaloscypha variabilis F]|uniref:2EXR domain-containing protein n=1 Tax=Hyaloscypha variabilis (strain UAMH 11265 / GT02V1 / F) TaxID=1149755 RepID=A0A2J6SA64_HYAVF|nr:hypothetical protein L207DRAFT_162322 [Hyaloscypha variabilis F]
MNDSAAPTHTQELKFTCFPKLSAEVRLKIWGHALEPRQITLISPSRFIVGTLKEFKEGESVFTVARSTKQPVLLRVNYESRQVVLAKYDRAFGTLLAKPIYFNPDIDILQVHAISSHTLNLFGKGRANQSMEQKHEMEVVRQTLRHFMFRERLVQHFGFTQGISKSPNIESITMLEDTGRYPSEELSVTRFYTFWKQILKIKAKAPVFFFKSQSAMDEDFKVRNAYPLPIYVQSSPQAGVSSTLTLATDFSLHISVLRYVVA